MMVPWWATLIGTAALLALASEAGFRVARRIPPDEVEGQKHAAAIIVAAILVLLGLLLAFSVSIVESRFNSRRDLVLADANAIGTVYLRAELLPDAHRDRVRTLLRDYVGRRLTTTSAESLVRGLEDAALLHDGLWEEAVAVADLQPTYLSTALFATALNELLDIHESRLAVANYQRLPNSVLTLLYVVSMLALGTVGYSAGLVRARSAFATVSLVVAVAAVIAFIIDLDRPTHSLVDINQRAMLDLAESIRVGPEGQAGGGESSRDSGASHR